ncbi:MAG: LTA synthase family protein [Clostridiales Family XIII bacterium]|jgi:phosphoglycerol transferase MdoB-like AlkP superfamily enzyme|nr:LTA synthase family protein [Clostridiales Family XIII bacterium]
MTEKMEISEKTEKQDKRKRVKKQKKERKHGRLYLRLHSIFGCRVFRNAFFQAGLLSLFLMLVIEGFGHKSPVGGVSFFLQNPLAFIFNGLIIFATLSLAWLFKRRIFFYTLLSVLWLALGITNGIILMVRMTPFTTADLKIIDMGLDILPNYLSTTQIVLLIAALVLVLIIFVLIFLFAPKRKVRIDYKRTVASVIIAFLVMGGSWFGCTQTKVVATYFENLWDAYADYGVPYCFISTWLNKSISKPRGYSESMVNKAFTEKDAESMTSRQADVEKDFPNIVFLQLESFIDPDEVKGLEFSSETVPFFKELKEKYSSGYLTVPVVGGGTANTEFEAMSGMSVKFFGPGEYPYKSILKKETCETMAYDLKRLGYATHAIHNHRGTFYNRNTVFPNLGFDDFTSLEYMSYVSKTPKNFATDDVLIGEIFGALEATSKKDYIYTISVQGHGEYPTTKFLEDPVITVEGAKKEEDKYAYEYYIQQIMEMDDFVRRLTEELSQYGEDVVLVLYGDHLPALGMKNEDMKSGSTFKTQYVIWSNFEMEREEKDLTAYQLAAEVQRRIGMREGTLTVYHQDNAEKADYQDNLHLLQYDMLYGKRYVYDEKNPFEPTDMNMGYKPIRISEVVDMAGQYYIRGEGFTPFSKVSLNGNILDTVFMGSTVLKLNDKVDPAEVSLMKVSQVEKYNAVLSTTE